MKYNDGNGLYEMKKCIEVKDNKASYNGDELRYYSQEVDAQFQTVKQDYLNNVTKNIKKRIPKSDSKIMSSLSHILEPCTANAASDQETEEAIGVLVSHYGTDKNVNRR